MATSRAQTIKDELPFGEYFMMMQMFNGGGNKGFLGKINQLMGTALTANKASKDLTGVTLKEQFEGLKDTLADFADPAQGEAKFSEFYEKSWLKRILDFVGVQDQEAIKGLLHSTVQSIGSRIERDEPGVQREFENTITEATTRPGMASDGQGAGAPDVASEGGQNFGTQQSDPDPAPVVDPVQQQILELREQVANQQDFMILLLQEIKAAREAQAPAPAPAPEPQEGTFVTDIEAEPLPVSAITSQAITIKVEDAVILEGDSNPTAFTIEISGGVGEPKPLNLPASVLLLAENAGARIEVLSHTTPEVNAGFDSGLKHQQLLLNAGEAVKLLPAGNGVMTR